MVMPLYDDNPFTQPVEADRHLVPDRGSISAVFFTRPARSEARRSSA